MPFFALLFCAVLVGVDQYTKFLAVKYLSQTDAIELIPGFFSLTFVRNEGAAFGIFQGARWMFVGLTAVVLFVILIYYLKLPKTKSSRWTKFSLLLVGSGAVGNFIDRLLNGNVVDFLQFTFISFPVFNMADMYVVAGTILMAFCLLFFTDNMEHETQ